MVERHALLFILFIVVGVTACSPTIPLPTPSPAPATSTAPPIVVEASPTTEAAAATLAPTVVVTEGITATVPEVTNPPLYQLPVYTRAVSETISFGPWELYRIAAGIEVRQADDILVSDVDGDGDEDLLVPLKFIRTEGGEFSELSYLVNEGDHYTSNQSVLVGEQVFIQSMSLEGNTLLVQLYTHGERDFLCCPTALAEIRYEFDGTTWVDMARINLPATEPPLGTEVGLTIENISFDTSGFAARPILQLVPDTDMLPPVDYPRPNMPERLQFSFNEIRTLGYYEQTTLMVYRYDPTRISDEVPFQEWLASASTEVFAYPMEAALRPRFFSGDSPMFVATNPAYFDFGSGSGMRYLVLPGLQQAFSTYDNFYYIYRGLSADEQHEVLFIYPLSHPDLDALLPLGTTGDTETETAAAMAQMQLLAEGDLSETIAMLDAFVASITITR